MNGNSSQGKSYKNELRAMVSKSKGEEYQAIESLEEAKRIKSSYLILQGDDGGQIYVVCPISLVVCGEDSIARLLGEIDDLIWKDSTMAGYYFEAHEPGAVISGGKGGGRAEVDLWVHPELEPLKNKIELVLKNKLASITE
ncbi:hypothetical protein IT407_02650 [Candidatus Uhrbacteria bacterium]|nr:hypothetical protein [Candidatus Uhrbacteria bacterium]